jgi:hypothetical protein
LSYKVICILLLSVSIFSCKKSADPTILPQNITGNWKLFISYCVCPSPPVIADSIGLTEIFSYHADLLYKKTQNGLVVDSANYTTGHNTYTPYSGAKTFVYDSIAYFKNGLIVGTDYYLITHDTLIIGPGIADRFSSYSLPGNGSLWFKKQ